MRVFLFFAALLIATSGFVVGTLVIIDGHRKRTRHRRAWPWAIHVAAMFVLAALATFVIAPRAAVSFCTPDLSVHCGFLAAVIAAPAAFGIAAMLYATAYAIWDLS